MRRSSYVVTVKVPELLAYIMTTYRTCQVSFAVRSDRARTKDCAESDLGFAVTQSVGGDKQPPNKALQRTRISSGCFPWRSVRAAELGRWASRIWERTLTTRIGQSQPTQSAASDCLGVGLTHSASQYPLHAHRPAACVAPFAWAARTLRRRARCASSSFICRLCAYKYTPKLSSWIGAETICVFGR